MIGMEPGVLFGGRYEIIKHLGAGGMGAVYLACDPRHRDFLIALKVLYPGVIKSEESRSRFRNEIVASYRINHRNIVRAYEYFDEADYQAYAMEYVDGGDLHQRMSHGPIETRVAIEILCQIAAGLEAVHAEGIVHRDLKPENVLLTKKGVVKITDFGVARLKGSQTLTKDGAMVGTPKYVAPEYIETGESDHRGDLYALGVIGYEMLSGRSPFRAESRMAVMVERFQAQVVPLSDAAPKCPLELARIIDKAMKVRLSERYQSAEELRQDLELLREGAPPTVALEKPKIAAEFSSKRNSPSKDPLVDSMVPPRAGYGREKKFGRKAIITAIILCLLMGLAFGMFSFSRNTRELTISELPEGVMAGSVSGLFADRVKTPLQLWKTKSGVYVLLGRPRCAIVSLNDQGRFKCGELEFKLSISSIERNNAVGTLTDFGWGTTATWSLATLALGEL